MRIHKGIYTILVVLLLATVSRSEDAQMRSGHDGIEWGEVKNGLQLGISPPLQLSDRMEPAGFKRITNKDGVLHFSIHLRNAGEKTVRLLPSLWSCLAMGDSGAIIVSQIHLDSVDGGNSYAANYHGWNHLRLLDGRRPKGESWQKTLGESNAGEEDLHLIHQEAVDRQIQIAPQDSAWPESVELSLARGDATAWQLTKPSDGVPAGTYRASATLVIDQAASEWKGVLTSGVLEVEIPATRTSR